MVLSDRSNKETLCPLWCQVSKQHLWGWDLFSAISCISERLTCQWLCSFSGFPSLSFLCRRQTACSRFLSIPAFLIIPTARDDSVMLEMSLRSEKGQHLVPPGRCGAACGVRSQSAVLTQLDSALWLPGYTLVTHAEERFVEALLKSVLDAYLSDFPNRM